MGTEWEFDISDGDSKLLLLSQLLDIGRIPTRERTRFKVTIVEPALEDGAPPKVCQVALLINGAQAINGTGDLWLIDGIFLRAYHFIRSGNQLDEKIIAIYNTRTRKGVMNLGDNVADLSIPQHL